MENDWVMAKSSFLKMNDINQSQKYLKIIESKDLMQFKNPKTALFIISPWCWILLHWIQTNCTELFFVKWFVAYATVSNIENDNAGMAILTGILVCRSISNIQGAFKSAKKYNSNQENLLSKTKP